MTVTEHNVRPDGSEIGEPRSKFAAGLRALADLIDAHPDLRARVDTDEPFGDSYRFPICALTRERLVARLRELGGSWEKVGDDSWFTMRRDLGGGVSVDVFTNRENVCERVQVGVKRVREPDPELVNELPLVSRLEPVYEWRCPGSVLDSLSTEDLCGPAGDSDAEVPF